MRRLTSIVALCLTVMLGACQKDNFGYEKVVNFPKEGGTKVTSGTESIYTLSIGNYNGNEQSAEEQEDGVETVMAVHYDWLTAYAKKFSKEITLTAEPNTTGKRRVLYVYGMVDNQSADIKVIQDK